MLQGQAVPSAQPPGVQRQTAPSDGTEPSGVWAAPARPPAAPGALHAAPPAGQRVPPGTDPAIFVPVGTGLAGGRRDGEPRVLLALRHPRVREVLADLLAEIGGMSVVAEVGTVAGAMEAVGRIRPNIVVLDDALDDVTDGRWAKTSAFKVLPGIAARSPSTLVVLLSDYGTSSWELQAARQAGAAAVVDKTDRVDRLISVIEQVWAGATGPAGWPAG
jgi:CheY-like chemotaxis protein